MNNNVELLIRLIIPALFVVAWALNQVLSKEARPAPPPRGPVPDPFRNRLPPARRPADDPFLGKFERLAPPPPRPSPTLNPGQEFVIVESETRSARAPSTAAAPPTPSRAGRRNRNPRRPASSASTSGSASTKGGQPDRNRQGAIANLATGLTDAPVAGVSANPLGRTDLDPRASVSIPMLDVLRDVMATPGQVRQAILLNEILQPPIALRGRRPGPGPRSV